MSTNTETAQSGVLDWFLWIIVAALVGGAVYGNWYFQDQPLLYRVAAILGVAIVATLLAVQTHTGRSTWSLLKDARSEIRRVVWPTRTETTQTTLIVLVLVLIFALILWMLDSGLSWVVSSLIG